MEEVVFDAVKAISAGLNALGVPVSEEGRSLDFGFTLEDTLLRYASSFVGGALGGAVFEGINTWEKFLGPKVVELSDKTSLEQMEYFIITGRTNELLDRAKVLYDKGRLGNKNLSATKTYKNSKGETFYAEGTETDNQNLAVYQAIQTEIRNIKHFLNSNRWVASNKELQRKIVDIAMKAHESGESVKTYMERTGENPIIDVIVDGNFLSFASADIYAQMFEVYELEKRIATRKSEIRTTIPNLNDYEDAVKKDDEIKFLESQIKDQKKLVNDILNGEYADYYLEFGMFAADDVAQARITASENKILENVETYVKIIHGKNYKDLNTDQKFLYKKE